MIWGSGRIYARCFTGRSGGDEDDVVEHEYGFDLKQSNLDGYLSARNDS